MGVSGLQAREPGFYYISISDKNNGMVDSITVKVPNAKNDATHTFYIVGEYNKDGIMEDIVTGREIPFISETNSIFKKESRERSGFEIPMYYYEQPCYLKAKVITKGTVIRFLSDLEHYDVVSQYGKELNRILDNSSLGYKDASRSDIDIIDAFKKRHRG